MTNTENPTISVIVPVYDQDNHLKRCLDSILCQTYQELEIILVNDSCTDTNLHLINEFATRDERIKVVSHTENKGVFQARLTGFEASTGKYVAFVDSNDYISIDWFRKLLRQAERTKADIVVGEWCFDHAGAHRDYYNLDQFRIKNYALEGEQILKEFMHISGRNISWTVVWNKLYSRTLWNICYPMFKQFSESHENMLMWEGVVFSFALFVHAQKMTNVHGINYFYSSAQDLTTIFQSTQEITNKYIHDIASALKFGKQVLIDLGFYTKYETEFNHWKKYSMSLVYNELVTNLRRKDCADTILTAFECNYEDVLNKPVIFSLLTTPLGDTFDILEQIKKKIVSNDIKYVSFEIFDTLIVRPFFFREDLFELLSEKINKDLSAYVNFKSIRKLSERIVRQELHSQNSINTECTLDAIYGFIKDNYCFSPEIIDNLKEYEIELEIQFCTCREMGRELYELALESGKTVIILSDAFLPNKVTSAILAKNGYTDYKKIYVSSDLNFSTSPKMWYSFVQKELDEMDPATFIHIGSNYPSDVCNATACGWQAGYLPKTTALLQNSVPNYYTGEAFSRVYQSAHTNVDYVAAFNQYASLRSMASIVANKLFDNPYVSIHPDSDYNADPRAVGYGALGPHLLALCNWIYKIAKREHIGTIHFVARDGFLIKQAFESCAFPDVKTNYIRLSRKSLILADVDKVEDLYSLYDKIQPLTTPRKLSEYLEPIIPEYVRKALPAFFEKESLPFDKHFEDPVQFYQCMNLYINQVIDMSMLQEYKSRLKAYFSRMITPGDYLFDIGYSGRPEAALSNLLGYPVGSLYVHKYSDVADKRLARYNCPSEVFYQTKPVVTGVIREHIMMEQGPSTIGYKEENGRIVPILEAYESEYGSSFITSILQENALQFIKDYISYFGNHKLMFIFQNNAMSAFLEDYLHFSKPRDRMIFASLEFEDNIGEQNKITALNFWNTESQRIFANNIVTVMQQIQNTEIEKLTHHINSITDELERSRFELTSVLHSKSWKLTKPLRTLISRIQSK